jgi:uncharacterized protein YigE (DUF2233 family)
MISKLLFLLTIYLNQPYSTFTVESGKDIQFFWKDESGKRYGNFESLKSKNIIYACNGGAYTEDFKPCGLYIENGKELARINKRSGLGNFLTTPNGIFFIDSSGKAGICETSQYKKEHIRYANQSGPMLVIDGKVSPSVVNKKSSRNVRNGVGVRPNGSVVFAISRIDVSLSEFAAFFKRSGCNNALYFDGAISQAYPIQMYDNQYFGVIIAVTSNR